MILTMSENSDLMNGRGWKMLKLLDEFTKQERRFDPNGDGILVITVIAVGCLVILALAIL